MKHRETNSGGSFIAWGSGFNYNYNAADRVLDIRDARRDRPLLYIDFDYTLSRDPLLYVKNTDKAAQIKSLMFSNNTSLDLSENFDHSRLIAILEDSVRLARYSFDLQRKKYRRFATYFCEYHALKNIQIRKINAFDPEDSFYTAKLTTRQENFIRSQSSTVHGMIKNMSDKTISDLIAAECGHELQSAAHNLLTVSSKLGTLSRILNEKFVPADKIIKNSATEKAHQG